MSIYEKKAEYGGVLAHIRIPEEPTGLVFIAPGAQVNVSDDLIEYTRKAAEDKGQATVVAALGGVGFTDDALNVHGKFTDTLKSVIDEYMADNEYTPDDYEMIGHSMGGAAVLSLASDKAVSRITVIDPVPVDTPILNDIHCPTDFVVSNVPSFHRTGKRMHNDMQMNGHNPVLHKIDTSAEREAGHMFLGQEQQIAAIIQSQEIIGAIEHDQDGLSVDQEFFGAIDPEDNAPQA